MSEPTSCCVLPGGYCVRVDTLFNHDGVHVIDVGWRRRDEIDRLCLTVETHPSPVACVRCGVVAVGHGRRLRRLNDVPAFGEPVELVWRARRYRCVEPLCRGGSFTEDSDLAPSGALLTNRAAWWAIGCLQRDTASVAALARRLGVDWHTLWDTIRPLLEQLRSVRDETAGYWPERLTEAARRGEVLDLTEGVTESDCSPDTSVQCRIEREYVSDLAATWRAGRKRARDVPAGRAVPPGRVQWVS